ncbi:CAP domain-containing protein [Streptomyces sp. NPDC048340]|uniref:CAP domain-containing protein n=1 Tax=Streptomyces sp. NPDC048340 TaxID=3365537 RepID=UPI00370FEE48
MPTLPQNGQVWTLQTPLDGPGGKIVADLQGSNSGRGTRIQSYHDNGTRAQGWVFWAKENGTWLLETQVTHNTHGPGRAMAMDYNYSTGQTWLYNEHGQPNQRWCLEVVDNDWLRIKSVRTDEGEVFLTASQQEASALTLSRRDDNNRGQLWRLVPARGLGGGNPGGGQQQPQPQPQPQQPQGGGAEQRVLQLTNEYRQRNGRSTLTLHPALNAVAQSSAAEQARRNTQGHFTVGQWFGQAAAGGYRGAGGMWENAGGARVGGNDYWPTPERIVQAWIDEPSHRDNMLQPGATHLGVGRTNSGDGTTFWSQILAS